ncbi:polyhydroxyalkanoic acid system family protein [Pseudomonas alliivorans]|uniref:polyhydroxyalkanoic acid system family protein n=1 Tax=Pseudomonas alliivorans TaxID=2810613 RepID=UPI001AE22FCD|nr:polyhydroxyalkanoic acid system family protein [Pseudomonas alliivorans]MBP0952837.1 polyhydroxyalkanoic acid system family protein [Pseudomonas alliivorans]MEE4690187.1 polyhydroxyalkanoic acid system family protein [Pseudomonas alliivorans]MEE4713191.1 polyhydroxyalkanoic acid system family protein [Pseudomonas alliivorans]MEE4728698.1 polyhydroxyalkanoic acid system family protein [Pseudomonas alliivorans]MEE4767918.1 polyhydroxyalkanoic acid system family protein [Pseudomonas alliivoran
MAKITVERPHSLGREQAREKTEQLVEKLADRYGLAHEWVGDTVKLEGKGAKGKVEVEDELIRINIDLNFILSTMSGSIKSEVERVLDKALAA